MSTAAVAELRATLATRFPGALPLSHGMVEVVTTGLGRLDDLLPGGGLPRGRLVTWHPGGGARAVLRSAVREVVWRGERAVWVDAERTTGGDFWPAGPLLVRPAGEVEALGCAEELLRSGGFALVVLVGAERVVEEAVRLSRVVREGGGAFVAVAARTPVAHLRIRSRLSVEGCRWRLDPFGDPVEVEAVRVRIRASSLGWSGATTLELPVLQHRGRLGLDPLLVDRRGARLGKWRRGRSGGDAMVGAGESMTEQAAIQPGMERSAARWRGGKRP